MAIHLIALLLEWDGNVGVHVSQALVADTFLQPLISLAHSPLLCGQALDAMLRLMRAIGRQTVRSEKDHAVTMVSSTDFLPFQMGICLLISNFSCLLSNEGASFREGCSR